MPKRKPDVNGDNNKHATIVEPFPLLSLPFELLEEIALWFTQGEAVKVLTVNKALFEAFSRSLWRSIDIRVRHLGFPDTVWKRYGSLVRIVRLKDYRSGINPMVWLPNVRCLTVMIRPAVNAIFDCELLNLRKLSVFGKYDNIEVLEAGRRVIAWASKAEQRRQNVEIDWAFNIIEECQMNLLEELLESINHPKMCSVNIGRSYYKLDLQKIHPKLMQVLVKVDTSYMFGGLVSLCGQLEEGKPACYERLEHLAVSLGGDLGHSHGADFSDVDPTCLPSLRRLEIEIFGFMSIPKMEPLLMHTWPTVTELILLNFNDGNAWTRVLNCMPNVKYLQQRGGTCPTDPHLFTKRLHQLEVLIFFGMGGLVIINDDMLQLSPVTSNVKELEVVPFNFQQLSSEFLHFILFSTPKLETLKLSMCEFRKGDLDRYVGRSNPAVETLAVRVGMFGMSDIQLIKLLLLLPGIKKLKLVSEDQCEDWWKSRYPHLHVKQLKSHEVFTCY